MPVALTTVAANELGIELLQKIMMVQGKGTTLGILAVAIFGCNAVGVGIYCKNF